MSDTPETDYAYKNHPWDMHDNIPLEFARQLERERDEARSEIKKLKEELEWHAWAGSPAMDQAKIDELVEQCDRLAEALRIIIADYRLDGRVGFEADMLADEALAEGGPQ